LIHASSAGYVEIVALLLAHPQIDVNLPKEVKKKELKA
jgi:hypothetical protein